MLGVELVENDEFASPLDGKKFLKMWEKTRDLGVIIGKGGLFGNVCIMHMYYASNSKKIL